MATYQPLTRAERLQLLRQRQEEINKIKVGYDSNVLKLQNGITIVRILPPLGNMPKKFFHQPVGYHMIGNKPARCSEFTTDYAIKCPICEVRDILWRGGQRDKNLAQKVSLNKKYWMNVVVREERDSFDTAVGPKILKAGVTIFKRARSLTNDPDFGLIDDPEIGVDLKIEKTGEGRDTRYDINPRRGSTQPLIAGEDGKLDWDKVQEIMESAWDLSYVPMPENPDDDGSFLDELGYDPTVKVYSYERTVLEFGVCLETIHMLPEIIENASKEGSSGWNDDGEDGDSQTPSRGAGAPSKSNRGGAAEDIRSRINNLRDRK